MSRLTVLAGLALLGCKSEPEVEPVPQMDDVDLLIRASLDLRGVRPTIAELDRLDDDPRALDTLLEEYLQDDRFGDQVRTLWGEVYLTHTETYAINAAQFGDPGLTQADMVAAIGQEPLRILQHIAEEDLPYTDLVTADWTMADETLARMYPTDYPPSGTGWQQVQYLDGRPHAGVLTTNGMWLRYSSTISNANRKRASAVSRILLCHDYLVRPIDFDRNVNLLDEEAVLDALSTNPACVNCHVSLDPLASYFYGFWAYNSGSVWDNVYYHPEREGNWDDYTGISPGYFGEPGYTLDDLGQQIAGDHRFPECAVEQAWELLLRRDASLADTDTLAAHRDDFIAGDLTVRALVRSVVNSPEYRAGDTDADGFVPRKMATPELLASQIEDLTGFRWVIDGRDALKSDMVGYQTLAGGADGYFVTQSATFPSTTILLVQERLAQAAASYVADSDAEFAGGGRLFTEIDFSETPDDGRAAMVAQIQALHLRLYGNRVAADGPEVEANLELWSDLYSVQGDTRLAWAGLLSALLRDPDFLFY